MPVVVLIVWGNKNGPTPCFGRPSRWWVPARSTQRCWMGKHHTLCSLTTLVRTCTVVHMVEANRPPWQLRAGQFPRGVFRVSSHILNYLFGSQFYCPSPLQHCILWLTSQPGLSPARSALEGRRFEGNTVSFQFLLPFLLSQISLFFVVIPPAIFSLILRSERSFEKFLIAQILCAFFPTFLSCLFCPQMACIQHVIDHHQQQVAGSSKPCVFCVSVFCGTCGFVEPLNWACLFGVSLFFLSSFRLFYNAMWSSLSTANPSNSNGPRTHCRRAETVQPQQGVRRSIRSPHPRLVAPQVSFSPDKAPAGLGLFACPLPHARWAGCSEPLGRGGEHGVLEVEWHPELYVYVCEKNKMEKVTQTCCKQFLKQKATFWNAFLSPFFFLHFLF